MRVPMKVDYGVRALVHLAQYGVPGRLIRTAEIASRESIPEPYLDQVLTTLNKFGFIRSRRGPQGGHALARPSAQITLDEVVATLEGRTAPLDCIEDASECVLSSTCAQRGIWQDVEEAVQSVLRATSVRDLAERDLRPNVELVSTSS